MDWAVLLIPVVSAFIGWFTNWVAVLMMFYPIEFVGIKPYLGWQGIVPAHASSFAGKATDLITEKLINIRNVLSGFDARSFTEGKLAQSIDALAEAVFQETLTRVSTETRAKLSPVALEQIQKVLRAELAVVAAAILADLSRDIDRFLSARDVVMNAADRDRALIGTVFRRVGDKEFKFIERSGAYFGLPFGLLQMAAWSIYPANWTLPVAGFLVGYITNWLALKLVFHPREPMRIGPFVIQGLFHKRQAEVAESFALLISGEILNPENMVAHMVDGQRGEELFAIVEKHVGALLQRYSENPMMTALIPADQWRNMLPQEMARLRRELPRPGGLLHTFAAQAIDVYGNLSTKMAVLDSKSFESVLRPSFEKDEWKLIVAGGALGFAAGVLQLVYIFGGSLF